MLPWHIHIFFIYYHFSTHKAYSFPHILLIKLAFIMKYYFMNFFFKEKQ